MHGLHPQPLLDTGAQRLLVVQAAEADEHSVLMGLVFFPARVDFGDQGIEVGVWPEGPLGYQLFPAGRALLVPGLGERKLYGLSWPSLMSPHFTHCKRSLLLPAPQGSDDAVRAESVEALLGGHCVLQHVQADGTHELRMQRPRRDRYLCPIHDGFLGH